jgi:HSP20 family molecular chaperone IbpA
VVDYYEDDEDFRDIDSFYKRLMDRMFKEMQDFEKLTKDGKLKGGWEVKQINKPGVRGYVTRGQFQFGSEPVRIPSRALEEEREPLTDIFEEKESIKIYMELPGVDKSDIQLNVAEQVVEIKAKNFSKTVELPTRNVDLEKVAANYKNGVLEVTIPKVQKTIKDEKRRTVKIE